MQFFLYNNNVTDGSSSVQTWKGYKNRRHVEPLVEAVHYKDSNAVSSRLAVDFDCSCQTQTCNRRDSCFYSSRQVDECRRQADMLRTVYMCAMFFDVDLTLSCLWTRPQLMLLSYVQQQQRWLNSVYAALTRRRLYTLYNCAKAKTEGCRIGLYLHCRLLSHTNRWTYLSLAVSVYCIHQPIIMLRQLLCTLCAAYASTVSTVDGKARHI